MKNIIRDFWRLRVMLNQLDQLEPGDKNIGHYFSRLWPPAVAVTAIVIMGGAISHLLLTGVPWVVIEAAGYVSMAVVLCLNPFRVIATILFHIEAAIIGLLAEFSEMCVRLWHNHARRVRTLKEKRYSENA